MVQLSQLARIRQESHRAWLEQMRSRCHAVGDACINHGVAIEQVLLFGSRARGDFDGYSDIDLIAVGKTQIDAEAVADAIADAHLGDDLIAMSKQDWLQKAESQSPSWRAIFAEAVILYKHNS